MRCCTCFRPAEGVRPNAQGDDAASDASAAGLGSIDEAGDDTPPAYGVHVDGFEIGARGRRVVYYLLTVSRGSARWPIRRRFRQVASLHVRLLQGLGRSAMKTGLPRIPPKVTFRSLMHGKHDEHFLGARAARLQRYFDELLSYVRHVEQCEALHEFLCSVDVAAMTYEALLDLEQAIGRAGPATMPIEASAIAALPRKTPSLAFSLGSVAATVDGEDRCVICQEPLAVVASTECDAARESSGSAAAEMDVRILPCGHEYHFHCIQRWVRESNTCCVCGSVAVLPKPAVTTPEKQRSTSLPLQL